MPHWRNFEFQVAKAIDGVRNPGSGALGDSGDVCTKSFLVECKAPTSNQDEFRFTADIWLKAADEAKQRALIPAVAICLDVGPLYGMRKNDFEWYGNCQIFKLITDRASIMLYSDHWQQFDEVASADGRTPLLQVSFKNHELDIIFMAEPIFQFINAKAVADEQ